MSTVRSTLLHVLMRFLLIALPLTAAGWLAWDALGALAGVAATLLAGFMYYTWKLAQLSHWLDQPESPVPDASGMWGDVLTKLYKRVRQETRAQQLVADTLKRFQQAAEALPDAAVMLDVENRILWCNPTAERYLTITLQHDRGQLITNLLRQPQLIAALTSALHEAPISVRGHASPEQSLSLLIVAFGEGQKLLLAHDMTQIEKIDTMRRDFIANVSHELRTPLTVLAGFVETLQRANDETNPLFNKSLAHMQTQAQRMQSLIDDLLTLSRLEDTRNALAEQIVNVPALVASLLVDAEHLSAGRHTINCRAGDFWLTGSREELRSALSNLVSNAVRYTPPGGTVELIWEMAGAEPAFRVHDSGDGIAPEHLPRLTERFYRVDRSRSRTTGGTGLGLAIVKHALNRHQARLEIDSEPGRGSTFSAVFPASRLAPPATEVSPAVSA